MICFSKTALKLFLLLAGLNLLATTPAYAQKRIALIIGNSVYANAGTLKNPANDANLMAGTLEKAGFEVTKLIDADLTAMKRAMLNFGRALRRKSEAGLFYYAGHGVQVKGENYLIPVNAAITSEDEIQLEAINVNAFLQIMNSSASSVNIVVLDSCRNNPFARSFRSASRGLAPVDAPRGTYIAYSTAPGDVAADGAGKNSPYTTALAKAINTRGIAIEQVFKKARVSVLSETNSEQVPWETSSITGDFYFHGEIKTAKQDKQPDSTAASTNEAERIYAQIKETQKLAILKAFVEKYSSSFYAILAKARLDELTKKQNAIREPDKSDRLAKLKEADRIWQLLKTTTDISELEKFARKFSDTAFATIANARISRLQQSGRKAENDFNKRKNESEAKHQWENLQNSNDIGELISFIQVYPSSSYSKLAAARLRSIQTEISRKSESIKQSQTSISKIDEAARRWKQVSQSTNRIELTRFMNKYRNTRYSRLALDRMKVISRQSPETIGKLDEAAKRWAQVSQSTNRIELTRFMNKYRNTRYSRLALDRMKVISRQSPETTSKLDEAARRWAQVSQSTNRIELTRFMNKYTNTRYARLALDRMKVISNRPVNTVTRSRNIKKVGSRDLVKIATSQNWRVYHRDIDGGKSCNTQSVPISGKAKGVQWAFVSNWNYQNRNQNYHVPSVGFVKKILPVSKLTWEIAGTVYDFTISNHYGFLKNNYQRNSLIEAMRTKSQIVMRTTGKNGRTYVDRFSLRGITATLKHLDKACPKY